MDLALGYTRMLIDECKRQGYARREATRSNAS
jgi:hypothetical protein